MKSANPATYQVFKELLARMDRPTAIRELLKDAGVTQERLGEEIGCHPSNISKTLAGEGELTLIRLRIRKRVSEALGLPEEVLWPEEGRAA